MTQIDYDREMAFVAVGQDGPFSQQILGVVRAIASPDQSDAEFAILVRSDLKGLGLGKLMMEKDRALCQRAWHRPALWHDHAQQSRHDQSGQTARFQDRYSAGRWDSQHGAALR